MTAGLDLQLIALAVPVVHGLAHDPQRAISNRPVESNKWTDPYLARYPDAAHPHLRRASRGITNPAPPIGPADQEMADLYRHIAQVLLAANPLRSRTTPQHDPPPHELISLAGQLHRYAARNLLVDRHVIALHALAGQLRPLLAPRRQPASTGPTCRNPRHRNRCTGLPLEDRTLQLCTSCYQHEAYRARRGRASLLVDRANHPPVVSRTLSHAGPTCASKPHATVTTTCATCGHGYTVAWVNGAPAHVDCVDCREAMAS